MEKQEISESQYDDYLLNSLKNRIKRVGKYNYNRPVDHICLQNECQRDWKPIPKEIYVTNKNYCPSCVMSWSNRTDRFIGWRDWTKDIQNWLKI